VIVADEQHQEELREKLLPADLPAERATLGACLLDRDAVLAARHIVSAADFYLVKHAMIWRAMLRCVEKRVPPDLATVASELREKGELDQVGGPFYLGELVQDTPTAVHVEHYADTVKRTAARRRIIDWSGEIARKAYDEDEPEDIHREIASRLEIEETVVRGRPDWHRHVIRGDELYKAHFDPQPFIIEQVLPQGTFILTGKPKTKKSWLALNYALAVAWGGKALGHYQAIAGDVLYVDLEMGQRRLHDRLHVISPNTVVPASLHFATEWPRVYHGCEQWIDDWMTAHPYTRLIIFDTQVAIRPPRERHEEPYEHEKRYMQTLSNLCHDYGIAMLLIHHSRKVAGADVIDDASGTTGLTGGADNYGSLSRSPHEKDGGILRLMGRDIQIDDDLSLKWDVQLAQWVYQPDAEDYSISPERRMVLRVLDREPGLIPQQIAERISKDPGNTRKLLMDMKKAGLVLVSDGRYYGNEPTKVDTA
jgi:hypothetical protein